MSDQGRTPENMAARRKGRTGGGPGTNQYGIKGTAAVRPDAARVDRFGPGTATADAGSDEIPTSGWGAQLRHCDGSVCPHCKHAFELPGPRAYECEPCGVKFASEDGPNCPQCNKFASKTSNDSCPNCERGVNLAALGQQTWFEHPAAEGETFASVDAALAWEAERPEREAAAARRKAALDAASDAFEEPYLKASLALYERATALRGLPPEWEALIPETLRHFLGRPERVQQGRFAQQNFMPEPDEILTLVGVRTLDLYEANGEYKPIEHQRAELVRAYDEYKAAIAERGLPDLFDDGTQWGWRSRMESAGFQVQAEAFVDTVIACVTH